MLAATGVGLLRGGCILEGRDKPMAPRKHPGAVALGRRGGKVTSPAKAAAARANGLKGGRPKKSDPLKDSS